MKSSVLVIMFTLFLFMVAIYYIGYVSQGGDGVVTFTFDDSPQSLYKNAYPLLELYGYRGTVYVITSVIGENFEDFETMSVENLKELQAKGWEIGSHTVNHYDLTSLHVGFIDYELLESKEQLLTLGFEVNSLAIPYGKYDDTVNEIAKEYYSSVRPSVWGVNNIGDLDSYEIKSIWLTNTTQFEFVKQQIDSLGKDEWLVFMVHNVEDEDLGTYNISPSLLREILDYIKQKNIKVRTVSEVIEEYGRV